MSGPCSACGATLAACDLHIREYGTGCCAACFTSDAHGLLQGAESQDIANLHRLAAQAVIARHEHAVAIRALQADVRGLVEENALLRGEVAELTRQRELADDEMEADLMKALFMQVGEIADGLPQRVRELEDCVAGLEQRLRLRRRPVEQRQMS